MVPILIKGHLRKIYNSPFKRRIIASHMKILSFLDEILNHIKTLIKNGLKGSIGRNVLSLYFLQAAKGILPLITVPYLVRVLGPKNFGIIAFGQGLMAYFTIIVNYGFYWSATRRVSVDRDNLEALRRTAASVWSAKALLGGSCFVVLMVSIQFVPRLREIGLLLLVLYGIVVGNMLFPMWLFQGLERITEMTLIVMITRLVATAGIFVLVHAPSDIMIYAGLLSFQWISAGLIGMLVSYCKYGLRFLIPGWGEVRNAFVEGWPLFLSMGAVSRYADIGNTFILGLLADHAIVGYYSAAEKIVKCVHWLLNPTFQALYPRFSRMANENSLRSMLYWARTALVAQGALGLILTAGLFVGAPMVVRLVLGTDYEPSISIIRILAALPLLIGIGTSLDQFILLPMGLDKARLYLLWLGGLSNILLPFAFVPAWSANGMALAVLVSETIVTCSFYVYLRKHHLSPV